MDSLKKISSGIATIGRVTRFLPEPRNRLLSNVTNSLSGLASDVFKNISGATTSNSSISIDPEYADLLNRQIEIQQRMQVVNMDSNIEKSKHETLMAPIRNIKVQ
jgi:hypothetical protein